VRSVLRWGGVAAGIVLIAFGIGAIVLSLDGRSTVHSSLKQEQIVGTPDMTPDAIKEEAEKAGLSGDLDFPSEAVAGKQIDTGDRARVFAGYMRIHALEATGGLTYSQMPRYATADGKGTNNPDEAQKGPNGRPLDNAARQLWVTETALATALNSAYLAEQLAIFGIVVGIALLLAGIGFIILALNVLRGESGGEAPAAAAS
jgi:hypothetical protein